MINAETAREKLESNLNKTLEEEKSKIEMELAKAISAGQDNFVLYKLSDEASKWLIGFGYRVDWQSYPDRQGSYTKYTVTF